jgi:hypothetical protein
MHGDGTTFETFDAGEYFAVGRILRKSDGAGVPGGNVIVRVEGEKGEHYHPGGVRQDGSFGLEFPEKWQEVEAYYMPAPDYAPCTSEVIKR